jgi:hypothetical protein
LTTSTITGVNGTFNTLTTNSTLTTSTLLATYGAISTLATTTATFSTITVHSTLTTSTLLANNVTVSTMNVIRDLTVNSTLYFSSLAMLPGYLTTLNTGYTSSMVIQIGANTCLIPVVVL